MNPPSPIPTSRARRFDGTLQMLVAAACLAVLLPVTATAAMACSGDCDGDGYVTVDELVRAVTIALGRESVDTCPSIDRNGDGAVTVEEVIVATSYALRGCPPPDSPTATPTATPTGDRPPELTCRDIYRTYPGFPIDFQIEAFDPNGGTVTFAAADLPEGASLDEAGRFQWTPDDTQQGAFHIRFTATDDTEPPLSTEGELMFKVSPLDSCTLPTCSPESGCQGELIGFDATCCSQGAGPRVAEPFAGCPQGRILFVGRSGIENFQRIHNCDAMTYNNLFQSQAFLFFDLEARCLRADRAIRAQIRLVNAARVALDEDVMLEFDPIENGFLFAPDIQFRVRGSGPFFDMDDSEANMTVTLTDADGASVTGEFRIVTTQEPLSTLPNPDAGVVPPEPGPCNNISMGESQGEG